jgi:hypothetical protein
MKVSYEVADAAAVLNREFATDQIVFMLPPALMNSAADASATNARRRVYSMRS